MMQQAMFLGWDSVNSKSSLASLGTMGKGSGSGLKN
jgi:hypothetical protein